MYAYWWRHLTYMYELCHTLMYAYTWVTSHMSMYAYTWVTSHMRMSRVTYIDELTSVIRRHISKDTRYTKLFLIVDKKKKRYTPTTSWYRSICLIEKLERCRRWHTHTRSHTHTQTRTHTHMHIHAHTCAHTRTHTHRCRHTSMHTQRERQRERVSVLGVTQKAVCRFLSI